VGKTAAVLNSSHHISLDRCIKICNTHDLSLSALRCSTLFACHATFQLVSSQSVVSVLVCVKCSLFAGMMLLTVSKVLEVVGSCHHLKKDKKRLNNIVHFMLHVKLCLQLNLFTAADVSCMHNIHVYSVLY